MTDPIELMWENLVILRDTKGISFEKIGAIIGSAPEYMYKANKRKTPLRVDDVLKIAEAYGVTVDDIMTKPIGLYVKKEKLESELAQIDEEIRQFKEKFKIIDN